MGQLYIRGSRWARRVSRPGLHVSNKYALQIYDVVRSFWRAAADVRNMDLLLLRRSWCISWSCYCIWWKNIWARLYHGMDDTADDLSTYQRAADSAWAGKIMWLLGAHACHLTAERLLVCAEAKWRCTREDRANTLCATRAGMCCPSPALKSYCDIHEGSPLCDSKKS